MRLAKPALDIGLATADIQPMLDFWTAEVGLSIDHVLAINRSVRQHRFDADGSVVKINENPAAPAVGEPSGYRELLLARPGLAGERRLHAPDGSLVRLVSPGTDGVEQLAVRLVVRDLQAHRRFYREALGLEETDWAGGTAFRAGRSLLLLEQTDDAPSDAQMTGPGWRYITFQVFRVDEDHARVLAAGGREARAPMTLGTTARISMVRDPDGNWIELSQRASIVGALD